MHRSMFCSVLFAAGLAGPAVAGDACIAPRLLVGADIAALDRIEAHDWPAGGIVNHFVGAGIVNLRNPRGMIEGPDGRVYVASSGAGSEDVFRFDRRTGRPTDGGTPFITALGGGLSGPWGLAFDDEGFCYVANNDGRVRRFTESGLSLGVFAGTGSWGQLSEIVFTGDGALLVASFSANRIYRIEADGTLYEGDGILVANGAGGLLGPSGMAIGPDGLLYVCSSGSDEVRRYDPADGSPVGGDPVFIGAEVGGLDDPRDLQFTPDGRVLVASFATDRVIEFDGTTGLPVGIEFTAADNPLSLLLVFDDGPRDGCSSDLDDDGAVGFDDLLRVLTDWGACP